MIVLKFGGTSVGDGARIAAVAGVAVAVAILATAVFTYLATRSSLRGEVDSALAARSTGSASPSRSPVAALR